MTHPPSVWVMLFIDIPNHCEVVQDDRDRDILVIVIQDPNGAVILGPSQILLLGYHALSGN